MINHISWVIGNTVVEYLNEEDATELHTTSIQWMDEVGENSWLLSEIAEFQDNILERIFDLTEWKDSTFGASGKQHELFSTHIWTDDQLGWLGTDYRETWNE